MGEPEVGGQLSIETMGVQAVGTKVSMGNPHCVIFVDNFQEGWQRQAALIGMQTQFPQGTNVEYVVVRNASEIEIRLFERGVGETQSSGTGSCAAAVAAIASGRIASPVKVVAPGGSQIDWIGRIKFICGVQRHFSAAENSSFSTRWLQERFVLERAFGREVSLSVAMRLPAPDLTI